MSIIKRRYKNKFGKTKAIQKLQVEFRDHNGIVRRITAFSDKAASLELERGIKRLVALRMTGSGPDVDLSRFLESCSVEIRNKLAEWDIIDQQRAAVGKSLAEHTVDWRMALEAKGNGSDYIATTTARISRLAQDCGWRSLSDITATDFDRWRVEVVRDGLSIQSVNHYLTVAKGFCKWLVGNKRISENPLIHLSKKKVTNNDRRHVRRASDDGELERLFSATLAGREHHGLTGRERMLLYRLAIETGFRYSECWSLGKSSFDFISNPPTVTVASGDAKNRKERTNPISTELATDLKEHMALFLPNAKAFPRMQKGKGAAMLRRDLLAAGIPYRDECGQVRDFHSLRKTFGTRLARHGVPLVMAQRLLDHSDPKLTANLYTGIVLEDKAAAVAKLPALTGKLAPDTETMKKTGTDDTPNTGDDKNVVRPVDRFGTDSGVKIRTYGDTREGEEAAGEVKLKTGKPLAPQGKTASEKLEAASRIELENDGFANHCLTAWLRRLEVMECSGVFRKEKQEDTVVKYPRTSRKKSALAIAISLSPIRFRCAIS